MSVFTKVVLLASSLGLVALATLAANADVGAAKQVAPTHPAPEPTPEPLPFPPPHCGRCASAEFQN